MTAGACLRSVPTLLVLLGLAVLGWWGHRNDWTWPRPGAAPATEAWCPAHGVPHAICVECNEKLLPRLSAFGWCSVHGVSECPHCHPELVQTAKPGTPKYDLVSARNALPRTANDKTCKLHERRIQFESDEAATKAGLDIAVVGEAAMGEYVTANAEAHFDPARVTRVASPAAGRVRLAAKRPGEPAAVGELLAVIDAAEVGKAKAELLQSLAQKQYRTRAFEALKAPGAPVSEIRLREAEAGVTEAEVRVLAAEQALANFGFALTASSLTGLSPEDAAAKLRTLGFDETAPGGLPASTNLLPLRSPQSGVVVTADAVAGEVIEPSKTLLVVADPTRLVLTLHVREEDARLLKRGQTVRFADSQGRALAEGRLDAISPTIDDRTRTLPVRLALDNAGGAIRNNTFGVARVVLREEPHAIVVPNTAVHWDGSCHIVFVRDKRYREPGGAKVYHVRKVVPGAKDETYTELLAGALPGEVVATRGSAALRAELLKNNLGEG